MYFVTLSRARSRKSLVLKWQISKPLMLRCTRDAINLQCRLTDAHEMNIHLYLAQYRAFYTVDVL